MIEMPEVPKLLQIAIVNYKNLASVILPWSNGLGLCSLNGGGKTNLLECLALLIRTDRASTLVRGLVEGMRLRNVERHPELRKRLSEVVALADVQRLVPTETGA